MSKKETYNDMTLAERRAATSNAISKLRRMNKKEWVVEKFTTSRGIVFSNTNKGYYQATHIMPDGTVRYFEVSDRGRMLGWMASEVDTEGYLIKRLSLKSMLCHRRACFQLVDNEVFDSTTAWKCRFGTECFCYMDSYPHVTKA